MWESKIVVHSGNFILSWCEQAYDHQRPCISLVVLSRLPGRRCLRVLLCVACFNFEFDVSADERGLLCAVLGCMCWVRHGALRVRPALISGAAHLQSPQHCPGS